jgi:cupin 2 domain-containing protein
MVRDALAFGQLLDSLPSAETGEVLDTLLARDGIRIERIVSHGQSTPEGEWYDQDTDEWVVILRGAAKLHLETENSPRNLGPGDFVYLPAGCRHRVTWTSPDEPTIWLAIHMTASAG